MRVYDKPKVEKKVLPEGITHEGVVEDHKIISFDTKTGTGYGLKLAIKPVDPQYFATTAFDFIGHDGDGPYVYKDSKMKTWLCRIFGTEDLAKVIIGEVKNKRCLFTVKNEIREFKNKEGVMVKRMMADVTDVFAPVAGAVPRAAPQPVATTAPTTAAPAPTAQAPKPAASTPPAPAPAAGGWDDGEQL